MHQPIEIPTLNDDESRRLTDCMAVAANKLNAVHGIENFAVTGWLPDEFFELLQEFYSIYDNYIYHNTVEANLQIACHLTCDRCCKQPVRGLYSFEIISLYRRIRQFEDYKDIHKLLVEYASEFEEAVQALLEPGITTIPGDHPAIYEAHYKLSQEGKPCPLLFNRICRIYEQRPVLCRMYHSLTSPSLCTTPEGKTFLLEPPKRVDRVLRSLSKRLQIPSGKDLTSGLLLFGADQKFRPWKQ